MTQETDIVERLTQYPCPRPIDHQTAVECVKAGQCGCCEKGARIEGMGWQTINDLAKDGRRINLCWKAAGGLPAHFELGHYRDGWCNTYGKPFHGEPDFWQEPPPPPDTPPTRNSQQDNEGERG